MPTADPTARTVSWIPRGGGDADIIYGEAASDQSGESVSLNEDGTVVAIGAPRNSGSPDCVDCFRAGNVRVFAWDEVNGWVQRGDNINGKADRDYSGTSVSLSADGTVVAIGAPRNDDNGENSGHARVWAWNEVSGWVQRGPDILGEASDHNNNQGASVSLSADGTTLAYGAWGNSGGGNLAGHARVFGYHVASENWFQLGEGIDGEAANDYSGCSVSLNADGTALAVGAYNNYGADGAAMGAGHVRVFTSPLVDNKWVQRGDDIDGQAAYDSSGHSVSLSADGTVVAVGAPYNDDDGGNNAGHARVFAWEENQWIQRGGDIDGEYAGDYSGYSLSLSADGTVLAVGAHRHKHDTDASFAGHARVFAWDSVAKQWEQSGADIDGEPYAYSGISVSLSGDGTALAVGAYLDDPDVWTADTGSTTVYRAQ